MLASIRSVALAAAGLAACLFAGAAVGQAPQSPPVPDAPPSSTTAKPAEKAEEGDMLRIRGQVESVDETGARVQLSKGISIRVDIAPDTPVFSVNRISMSELAAGSQIGIRITASPISGENSVAADVLALGGFVPGELTGLNVRGVFKSLEKSGDKPALVVTDRGADRRFTLTKETAVWRLQPGRLRDIKAGEMISVLIVRDPSGQARAQRAVFGASPSGGQLPL
jgi:hypothetical protein